MRDWQTQQGRWFERGPMSPLGGPISILCFATLLVAGFLVLSVLCSGVRDPAAAIADWRTCFRGGHLTMVDLCVGAILTPFPSLNHTFQAMDWAWGPKAWDMRWLRIAVWIAPAAYFAVAHYRYEGSGSLIVAGVMTVLTWLAALGYPKLDKTGFAVASSS